MANPTVADIDRRVELLEGYQSHYDDTVSQIRGDIKRLEIQLTSLTKSNNEMREVVFNGLRDRVKNIYEMVQYLAGNRPGKRQITLRRILETLVVAGVTMGFFALVLMLFLGRLTADDIATILRAWQGVP